MYGEGVLCVLTNYKRPQNITECVEAWRNQSVPPKQIVVVDNSPMETPKNWSTCEPYPAREWGWRVDDIWRMKNNLGCPCRFGPAMCLLGYKYVLFVDDDLIPGRDALAHLLETARKVKDEFATIGGVCRTFLMKNPPGDRYNGRSGPLRQRNVSVPCSLTCQAHLVRGDVFQHVIQFRNSLLECFGKEAEDLCSIHDDFLLCLGIQRGTGWHSWAIPVEENLEQRLVSRYLDSHDTQGVAVWKRPTHFIERNRLISMALEVGWKSLI